MVSIRAGRFLEEHNNFAIIKKLKKYTDAAIEKVIAEENNTSKDEIAAEVMRNYLSKKE